MDDTDITLILPANPPPLCAICRASYADPPSALCAACRFTPAATDPSPPAA